jgi:hypothetical protein
MPTYVKTNARQFKLTLIVSQKWVDPREDRPIELGTRRTATIEEPE